MTEQALSLTTFYAGWNGFQQNLVKVITPLSSEQLALPTARHHWSIGMIVQHILANRVWWFQTWMGEGNPDLAPIASWGWDQDERPVGEASELIVKLEATWHMIAEALARWTPANLGDRISVPSSLNEEERQRFSELTRQWIIWHVLEHEILHGGELSLALGTYGLKAIYD